MKLSIKFFALSLICLLAVACGGKDGCIPTKCEKTDVLCKQPMEKHPYPPPGGGPTVELGVISYLVTSISDKVRGSAQLVFNKITQDKNYKNLIYGMAMLFVLVYGIVIALQIVQPSPMELVVRIAKLAVVFYLLTSWANFQEIVVDFFEGMTDGLTTVLTTAVVSSASGSAIEVTAIDVFGFIDDEILGLLLSPRFTSIIGAISTIGNGAGIIIALMLASVILSYLWTVVISVQIYLMAVIARTLLYAISPIFIIFLLFQQTRSLFDGWLKQLINFSLQPIFLIGFMAFFNGVFFNYLDRMFEPGYKICYSSEQNQVSGQTIKLSNFKIVLEDVDYTGKKENDAQHYTPVTKIMDVFTLFVVLMLGNIMVKMNQWAVQAAMQLSEGGISFTQTMQGNAHMAQSATKGFGEAARKAAGLKK